MRNLKKTPIIVIVGPTASGKSDLGIKLAKKFNGEIISADSRQVYRGMDIGTGKVSRDKIKKLRITHYGLKKSPSNSQFIIRNHEFNSKGIRHHLIDVVSPKKQFTADDFKRLGEKAIFEIQNQEFLIPKNGIGTNRHKLPIIVGGTGFYIDVLLGRTQLAKVSPNYKLRARLDKLATKKLFEKLKKLDSPRSEAVDPHNKRRLIRAIEIAEYNQKHKNQTLYPIHDRVLDTVSNKYDVLWLGLCPDKDTLARKIKKRLDKRLEQGMLKEVENLRKRGVSWKRMDELGLEYRWISRYLKSNNEKGETTTKKLKFKDSEEYRNLLQDIVKYSKRQMTWFRRNKEIYWVKNKKEGYDYAIYSISSS